MAYENLLTSTQSRAAALFLGKICLVSKQWPAIATVAIYTKRQQLPKREISDGQTR